jgi:hypothetical protein
MGDLPIEEAQEAWPGKAIWCNFPEALFLERESVVFEKALDLLTGPYAKGRFILGMTEDIPDDRLGRGLGAISEAISVYQDDWHVAAAQRAC